jgi:hypothetical protein
LPALSCFPESFSGRANWIKRWMFVGLIALALAAVIPAALSLHRRLPEPYALKKLAVAQANSIARTGISTGRPNYTSYAKRRLSPNPHCEKAMLQHNQPSP